MEQCHPLNVQHPQVHKDSCNLAHPLLQCSQWHYHNVAQQRCMVAAHHKHDHIGIQICHQDKLEKWKPDYSQTSNEERGASCERVVRFTPHEWLPHMLIGVEAVATCLFLFCWLPYSPHSLRHSNMPSVCSAIYLTLLPLPHYTAVHLECSLHWSQVHMWHANSIFKFGISWPTCSVVGQNMNMQYVASNNNTSLDG